MSISRSTRWGAFIGASCGSLIGVGLLLLWHFDGRGDEALEGTTLLSAFLSWPTSNLLWWISDIGDFPGRWIRFIVISPAVQYGMLGAAIGAVWGRPKGRSASPPPGG
jgi:hypothetical protein